MHEHFWIFLITILCPVVAYLTFDLLFPSPPLRTRAQIIEVIIRCIRNAERPCSFDAQHDNMIEAYTLMYQNNIKSAEILEMIRSRDATLADRLMQQGF